MSFVYSRAVQYQLIRQVNLTALLHLYTNLYTVYKPKASSKGKNYFLNPEMTLENKILIIEHDLKREILDI